MSNSTLASYILLSPNHYNGRTHKIDTITIHCMAGNLTIEQCGSIFSSTSRQASSNYGIGSDGRIAVYVDETNGSWCSSNKENDMRAVTIEVANDGGESTGWHVSDAAMKSLINLCADICKRNNIESLKWHGDKSLIGQIDKQNMTVHRWFANKSCPGDYLYSKQGYIAEEVNKILGNNGNWEKDENGWWYKNSDGSYPKNQWLQLNHWYYFDSEGYAIKNDWKQINNNWYYFDSDCNMVIGWKQIKGVWYYFNSEGAMQTGWQKVGSNWYYMDNSGAMQTGLQNIGGDLYYLADDGHMCMTDENGKLK